MSSILLPRRFYSQPQGAVGINKNLVSGKGAVLLPVAGGVRDVLNNKFYPKTVVPSTGGIAPYSALYGVPVYFPGQSSGVVYFSVFQLNGVNGITQAHGLNATESYGTNYATLTNDNYSSNKALWQFKRGSTTITGSKTYPNGRMVLSLAAYVSGSLVEVYGNGELIYQNTAPGWTLASAPYTISGELGNPTNTHVLSVGESGSSKYNYLAGSVIAYSAHLAQAISANPWQIFRVSE